MSVLWIEGFEQFSGTNQSLNSTQIERKYEGANTDMTSNPQIVTGHGSTAALAAGSGGNLDILDRLLDATHNRLYISLSLRYDNLGPDPIQFLVLRLGSNTQCVFRIFADGTIDVRRGTGTIVDTTASGVFPMDQWVRVEVLVECQNSGEYDFRVNGTSVLSGTGDLQNIASPGADTVRFIFEDQTEGAPGDPGTMKVDNWVIQDSTGDFLISDPAGEWYVEGLFPDTDGDASDFTRSTGTSGADLVDDLPADDDTTYVESSTVSDQELYNFDSLTPLTSGFSVSALQVITTCKGGGEDLVTLIDSGTTTDGDTGQTPGADFETLVRVSEQDPDTSSAWGETGVNNAQFGFEVG